jgi:hypothetical protein
VEEAALLSLVGLGAVHGLNPAMGWLFAVAIGLQERSRSALAGALVPIAIGHELSVAVAVLAIELSGDAIGQRTVGIAGAIVLVAFGAWKLFARRSHPQWVGARLSKLELAWWSFLMSTAHGAGLMLLPVLGGEPHHETLAAISLDAVAAAGVHTLAMLAVMAAIALTVYEVFGVGFLRRGWVNLDRLWAGALVCAGAITLVS